METIDYHIDNAEELASSRLSFIKGGGLFLKTQTHYALGEAIKVSLKLLDDPVAFKFEGKVVWIIPPHEQNHLPQGIGVQFAEEQAKVVQAKIESVL